MGSFFAMDTRREKVFSFLRVSVPLWLNYFLNRVLSSTGKTNSMQLSQFPKIMTQRRTIKLTFS